MAVSPVLSCQLPPVQQEQASLLDLDSTSSLSLTLRTRSSGDSINKYPAKAHARRVAAQLPRDQIRAIALQGAKQLFYPNSDIPIPFRQERYFYYLTGCPESGCCVTYSIATDRLVLWLPPIDLTRVVWTGRGSTVEEALDRYDVDEARYLRPHRHDSDDYIRFPCDVRSYADKQIRSAAATSHVTRVLYSRLMQERCSPRPAMDPVLQGAIDACRVIKDAHEIRLIRQANTITAEAHTAVLRNLHAMDNEADVEAAYTGSCIASHARDQAYAPIAGSGAHASELHYTRNEASFGNAQTVVLDAGCEWECYASDVTRTLPLNPRKPGTWASKEARAVYTLVEQMQEQCIARVTPGVRFRELDHLARRIAIEGLLKLGVLKGAPEEIEAVGVVYAFFYHGLGHHLGLEVHDVSPMPINAVAGVGEDAHMAASPTFTPLDAALLHPSHAGLEPGMVITVEPGLYFNSFLLHNYFLKDAELSKYFDTEVLARYMPVGGVRIEDDILVTREGYENLTTAPKGEEALRIIREGAEKTAAP